MFPIRFDRMACIEEFDWPHPDPYDRILCAQELVEGSGPH
jgi:PIN domain nuclease of toxin-antitoxin system